MNDQVSDNALRIAVVGHTNTGKTSLLRTLTRDKSFGEVSAMPSTTRHVQGARLAIGNEVVVELFDTPGLEEAIALLESLDSQSAVSYRDGPTQIEALLEDPAAQGRFEQEAKVLRQLLRSDAAVYVIDVRDPVLAKYRDELAILNRCAKPLLPLLNFVSSENSHEAQWRDALARLGLHVVVSFDTVAPALEGESIFYEKLATLLDVRGKGLAALMASHRDDAEQRRDAACAQIAELVIDVATCRVDYLDGDNASTVVLRDFNERVRAREQACVDAMLSLYRFSREDLSASPLPFSEGQWRDDLFDPNTLAALGLNVGSGAAAGAAAGFGVDLLLGGASLGTGAAVGALMGGGVLALRRLGRRMGHQISQSVQSTIMGRRYLRIDDMVLQALLTRQMLLLAALQRRGHAATDQLKIDNDVLQQLWQGGVSKVANSIRQYPSWSSLYEPLQWSAEREDKQHALTEILILKLDVLVAQWAAGNVDS